MTEALPKYEKCFFCGPATGGLALELRYTGGSASCDFVADHRFQGYQGVLHGGIVTGILDEVMWWTLFVRTRIVCVTTKIEVDFLRPVSCGTPYSAVAELEESSAASHRLSAVIVDKKGRVCARGTGFFRKTRGITLEEVKEVLDFRGVSPEIKSLFHEPPSS